MINGEPFVVEFNIKLLTKIFMNDMSPDKYDINFNEWRTHTKSGFVLTTPDIIKYMQKEFEYHWSLRLQKAQQDGTF